MWTVEFVENGGYDCMTDAWFVRSKVKRRTLAVDLGDYGQQRCRTATPEQIEESRQDAQCVCDALNQRDAI